MATLTKRPIQVYLEQQQDRALRRLAKNKGVSISELIRQGVQLLLDQIPVVDDPAWDIVGLGASDVDDLASRHDEHLVEELQREMRP